MSNQLDLSQLTKQQLIALAWVLKGTPNVDPIHRELRGRPSKTTIKPDDPDWDEKTAKAIAQALGIS